MPVAPLIVVVLTYAGLAAGRVPRLAVDRTGFALLGAVAMLAVGALSLEEAKDALHAPTMAVLFGLMLLSAQYEASGLYAAIARRVARERRPRRLLLGTIVVAAGLAAVLTNDVVCFALTPLLLGAVRAAGLPPLPYLLALACATNIGSALTPIGNPQNILIAQTMELPFAPFVLFCAVPVVLSLAFLHLFLRLRLPATAPEPPVDLVTATRPLERGEAAKAIVLTAVAVALFLVPVVPAPLVALGVAGAILTSRRMHTRAMLGLVDWHLLALFAGLFVVMRGFELSGWVSAAERTVRAAGVDLAHPAVLVPTVALLGNVLGNVPAVMLLLPLLPTTERIGYGLALASTMAGNAVLVGSIANLIVAEQAERLGVRIGFRDHLRVGLPVTLASLAFSALVLAL